jgi:hypothetical protein
MSKKKACLNPNCSDYKKTKYKATEQACPHCQEILEFTCAKKGCYKVIPETQKSKYCPICKAEIDDTRAEIWDGAKKVGGLALSIGLSFVGVKFGGKKK